MAAATGVHFDLETLRAELAEVQTELRDWADSKVDAAQAMLQKQEEFLQSSEQARTELEGREATLLQDIQNAQKKISAMQAQLEEDRSVLEAMQVEHDELPGDVQELEESMAEKAKMIEDSQKYASKSISNEQIGLDSIYRLIRYYGEWLGLKIETRKESLLFSFDQICRANPEKEFKIELKVEQDYELVSCSPEIGGINDMVSELNKSGNLRGFICEMRRKFRQHSELGN